MLTPQIEQALYIRDLIKEKKMVKNSMAEKNSEDIWYDAATRMPEHFHSEMEPNYLELLMGLSGFDCQDDAPHEEIDILKDYINEKIDDKSDDIKLFLKLRLESIKSNIKYLKEEYFKKYNITHKEYLKSLDENDDGQNQRSNSDLNIDDILDKISEKGMNSLNDEERGFLKKKNGDNEKGKGDEKGKDDKHGK